MVVSLVHNPSTPPSACPHRVVGRRDGGALGGGRESPMRGPRGSSATAPMVQGLHAPAGPGQVREHGRGSRVIGVKLYITESNFIDFVLQNCKYSPA